MDNSVSPERLLDTLVIPQSLRDSFNANKSQRCHCSIDSPWVRDDGVTIPWQKNLLDMILSITARRFKPYCSTEDSATYI